MDITDQTNGTISITDNRPTVLNYRNTQEYRNPFIYRGVRNHRHTDGGSVSVSITDDSESSLSITDYACAAINITDDSE